MEYPILYYGLLAEGVIVRKSIRPCAWAVIFVLFSMSALAASATPSQPKTKSSVSLLFAFQVQNASLSHIKDHRYALSFAADKNDKVLAFTDRPDRVALVLTRSQWAAKVMAGKNGFESNPPNIVLSWQGPQSLPMAYQIISYKKNPGGSITYVLEKLAPARDSDKIMTRHGAVSVFVDDVYSDFDCTVVCTTSYLSNTTGQMCQLDELICSNACPGTSGDVDYQCPSLS